MSIRFAAVGLDHSHIYDQIAGLLDQGCQLVGIGSDDPDASIAKEVRSRWPEAPWFEDPEQLLNDDQIDLIVTAAVPDRRAPIAIEAMRNGKDVIADKPGCVTFEQLDQVRNAVAETGRFWSVTFSERFKVRAWPVRASWYAPDGSVRSCRPWGWVRTARETASIWPVAPAARTGSTTPIDSAGFSPTSPAIRSTSSCGSPVRRQPRWWPARWPTTPIPTSPRCRTSGRCCCAASQPRVTSASTGTPQQGLPSWGDGRLLVLGTEGYLEMRKYVDLEGRPGGDHLFLVDQEGTHYIDCSDVPLTYYPDLVRDVRERTTTACPQEHTFEVMRLALEAQQRATRRGAAR